MAMCGFGLVSVGVERSHPELGCGCAELSNKFVDVVQLAKKKKKNVCRVETCTELGHSVLVVESIM